MHSFPELLEDASTSITAGKDHILLPALSCSKHAFLQLLNTYPHLFFAPGSLFTAGRTLAFLQVGIASFTWALGMALEVNCNHSSVYCPCSLWA